MATPSPDRARGETLKCRYQLNPDRIKDEVITNALVKSMTCFPSPQFSLAMHLIPPSVMAPNSRAELPEAIAKLRELDNQLQGAEYARFWATLDSDDLYADMTTDIEGFEDMIRVRIATLISHAYREMDMSVLEAWLGMDGDAARKFVSETAGWKVDDESGLVRIPKNAENEAKKAEVREDVNVDMFSRVVRRAWEDTV
jgi:translation initiation factor 3 subunit K